MGQNYQLIKMYLELRIILSIPLKGGGLIILKIEALKVQETCLEPFD